MIQAQLSQARETSRVLQRQQERLEAELQIIQVKVDRPAHRRSASILKLDESDLAAAALSPAQQVASPAPSPSKDTSREIDTKKLQSIEAGLKKVEAQHQQIESLLQQHQHTGEEALRVIQEKVRAHEEFIKWDEKERERLLAEEEKSLRLQEKEREELEVRLKHMVTQQVEDANVEIKKLDKLQKTMEAQIQQIQQDVRERREEIDKIKIQRLELEEKLKTETREWKEELDKEKRRRREEKESEDREREKLRVELKEAKEKIFKPEVAERLPVADEKPKPAIEERKPAERKPIEQDKPKEVKPEESSKKVAPKEELKVQETPVAKSASKEPAYAGEQPQKPQGPYERAILWEYDPTHDRWMRLVCNLNIEANSFAEGALRSAFHAVAVGTPTPPDASIPAHPAELYPPKEQIATSSAVRCEASSALSTGAKFVVKIYKKESEQKATRELYFEDVKMQMVCRDWGNKFNQKKPPKRIEFLMAWVLELPDRDTPVLCNMEPLLG